MPTHPGPPPESRPSALRCVLCPEDHADRLLGLPLAVVHYDAVPRRSPPTGPLHVTAPLPRLGGDDLVEVWSAAGPIDRGEVGSIAFAAGRDVLFGALAVPAVAPGELEAATLAAYLEILATVPRTGFPHLLRMWNCVPGINADEDGTERYKLFCRGRSLAFERHAGESFAARLPSASAVGAAGDRLVVYFLAGRAEGRHIENPRQVAAWAYPPKYGPRSPSFARATRTPETLGDALFISGTAAVVGHESVHEGNLAAQVDETMRNIAALIHGDAAAEASPATLAPLELLKVYVREPRDREPIAARLAVLTGGAVPTIYVEADICRRELLVEIEGIAR